MLLGPGQAHNASVEQFAVIKIRAKRKRKTNNAQNFNVKTTLTEP